MIQSMIYNILSAFYQPFWFAVVLSVLFMFVYKSYSNVKSAAKQWISWFKTDSLFRKTFILVFYTAMILFRTLLNRNMWVNPLSNVLGNWGIHQADGTISTEPIENFILFIPFIVILFWLYREKIFGKGFTLKKTVWISAKITFLFSLSIEMMQLLFRLGTWQVSDLVYNTSGGIFGGILYYLGHKIVKELMRKKHNETKRNMD